MFRLHLDFPLDNLNQEEAIKWSSSFKDWFIKQVADTQILDDKDFLLGAEVGIRLLNDNDRGTNNYLLLDDNGHAKNKKLKIQF